MKNRVHKYSLPDIRFFFYGYGYQKYIKRFVDIFGTLLFIIIFLPIALIVSIAIKLDTKGPIFADTPERVGMNNTHFRLLKFRSMIVNAHNILRNDIKFKKLYEQYKKGSYKLKNDPRITRTGRFIRKYSLDEIPQFINILLGSMSLVGPRAYYPDELENQQLKYPETKRLVKKVLSVKPGVTGLWQVSGRSNINFDKRIALDARYVDEMSLWYDIKIIIKTPFIMLSAEGAV